MDSNNSPLDLDERESPDLDTNCVQDAPKMGFPEKWLICYDG